MDSGNLSADARKYAIITEIMAELKYDAVGLGAMDSRTQELFAQAEKNKLTVLDASPDANKYAAPYIVKNVDGVKVGVVSFGGRNVNLQTGDFHARKAYYEALSKARAECDILVLLDQANIAKSEWIERNAARFGAPDIVIGGMPYIGLGTEQVVGKTHIMPTSMQARAVGVCDVEFVRGQDLKVKVQRIQLGTDIAEDPDTAKRIRDFNKISSNVPAFTTHSPVATVTYFSPHLCKTCHASQFTDWQQSKHAKAIKSLVDANRAVPECLVCHSEAYRKQQRIAIPADSIGGVECATCHMAALPHGRERANTATKTKVDPKLCVSCHDKANSPNYDEKTYFPKIIHKPSPQPTAPASAPQS